jgi:hypothetical protein
VKAAVAVFALFALLVGLRLHGFSLPAWHRVIDGSAPNEILLGKSRLVRSDDYRVQIPFALSQAAHDPPFPAENRLIGLGQSAFVPIEAPVAHPLILFRPTVWGFFIGKDIGIAWLWWSRIFGLGVVWYFVFRVLTEGRRGLSLAGATSLVAAPFFAFWSYNGAPHAAAMGAAFLATVSLLRAEGRRAIWASGAALALAGGWFALAFYPPYQVTLAWLYLALVTGFLLRERERLPLHRDVSTRTLALAAATLFVAAVACAFVWEAGDALTALQRTVYPGERQNASGDRPLWQIVNANFASTLWAESWGPFYNICEAASFWLVAPPLVVFAGWRAVRRKAPIDTLSVVVLVYAVTFALYAAGPFPGWLLKATGLGLVPAKRVVIGLGLADAVLVLRFLAISTPALGRERIHAAVIAAGWALALGLASVPLAGALRGARPWLLVALAIANGLLAWVAMVSRRRTIAAWVVAGASFGSSIWFNPLVVGGTEFLTQNELSRRIVEIDRSEGGKTTWAAFGGEEVADLFRILGVRSVNGLHALPQRALWRRIDPMERRARIYGRYAHIVFRAAPVGDPVFRLILGDIVGVDIDPKTPALRALGVTHVLLHGDEADRLSFEQLAPFERLGSVGKNHLYRVTPASR